MEMGLLVAAAFLFGTMLGLIYCLSLLFNSYKTHMAYLHDEFLELQDQMKEHIREFKDVGEKASAANLSLGQAITDFDIKLKDIETRIAMSRMQR